MELRDYQTAALDSILSMRCSTGVVVLPTGSGKTVIMSGLPQHKENRCLFLAHRDELLSQTADKLQKANPNDRIGIEAADQVAGDSRIVVASVPTLGRADSTRLSRLSPDDFGYVVCDEAHHSAATTYLRIFEYFGFIPKPRTTKRKLIGFTATPTRADGMGLGHIYDDILYERSVLDMIHAGWLTDIRAMRVETTSDLTGVTVSRGDFALGELADRINNPERNKLVAKVATEDCKDKKTMVFCCDVAHTQAIHKLFLEYGLRSAYVIGDMDKDERRRIISAYHAGDIQYIVNCMVLTEGFDDPETQALILARPTKSNTLFRQQIGRGMRPTPTKKVLYLYDLVDVCANQQVETVNSIAGLPPRWNLEGTITEEKQKLDKLLGSVPMTSAELANAKDMADLQRITAKRKIIDLFRVPAIAQYAKFSWAQVPRLDTFDEYRLSLPSKSIVTVVQNLIGSYTLNEVTPAGEVSFIRHSADLRSSILQAETFAMQKYGSEIKYVLEKDRKWRGKKPSPKQIETLQKLRIPYDESISKGEASNLISAFWQRRSTRQSYGGGYSRPE